MSKPEVGTEVWVKACYVARNQIKIQSHDVALWVAESDELIPVSPPLDAPDGPGMWAQHFPDGTRSARDVYLRDRILGADVCGVWCPISDFDTGTTWYRIPDGMFGAEKAIPKEEQSMTETVVAMGGDNVALLLAQCVETINTRLDRIGEALAKVLPEE